MATVRTVLQLIGDVLSLAGHYSPGEPIAAEDSDLVLRLLQDLLAEWAGQTLTVPCLVLEPITLAVAKNFYTVGETAGADKSTVRPEQIIGAFVRDSSNHDYPVSIIGERDYRLLGEKSGRSGRPTKIWPNYTAPNMIIYTYPTPDSIESLYIESIKTFTEPTTLVQDLSATVSIPRVYHNALKFNLAVDTAPHYDKQLSPLVVLRAQRTKSAIISLNAARTVQAANLEIPTGRERYFDNSILTFGE